ncbi:MAG: HIT family protein [Candidatus Hydrothermarchaeales archaeon]
MACELCDIPGDKILKELEYSIVSLGRPHHKGHLKVILKSHKEDLLDLTREESDNFFNDLLKVAKVVRDVLHPDKLNYELFGNWVPHLHWHILPRFEDDRDFGNPPIEPLRKEEFEKKELSDEELTDLKRALDEL